MIPRPQIPDHVRERMERLHAAMVPGTLYRMGDLFDLLGIAGQACLPSSGGTYSAEGGAMKEAIEWLTIESRITKSGQRRGTRYARAA